MMSEIVPPSPFSDFYFLALDHAFASIEDGNGPLVPFMMSIGRDGKKGLTRFITERLEDGVEQARAAVTVDAGLAMYAIAWDGYITLQERKWDAVFVEAGESSQELGLIVCQRYVSAKKGLFGKSRNEGVGDPKLVDTPPSRIWTGLA
jgi:hypothetical protein